MNKNHVIFGYTTYDVIEDINIKANTRAEIVNPKHTKTLVKSNPKRLIKKKK